MIDIYSTTINASLVREQNYNKSQKDLVFYVKVMNTESKFDI